MLAAATKPCFALPPLILHPFADRADPAKLLESSRVSLILQGLAPAEAERSELERRLLDGRFCEIRMLYYVGKDVNRWIEQCVEVVQRIPELAAAQLSKQTFAELLMDHTPVLVREKLRSWGVADYRSIFSRGLGLNAVFAELPSRETLTDDFVRNYYRFADRMYQCLFPPAQAANDAVGFIFDLYASAEYSRILEQEWGTDLAQPSEG